MDPRGLRVTQTIYFSHLTHAKQLSLVTFCETTAGIGKKMKVRQTYGRTDRREVWNSYLDVFFSHLDYLYLSNIFFKESNVLKLISVDGRVGQRKQKDFYRLNKESFRHGANFWKVKEYRRKKLALHQNNSIFKWLWANLLTWSPWKLFSEIVTK